MLPGLDGVPLRREFKRLVLRSFPAFMQGFLNSLTAAAARAYLGTAALGPNNDITSLTALSVGGLANGTVTAPDLNGAQTGSAPIFGARAWCIFDGTTAGVNAPIAGGNVSTVSRNSTGDYTITFTTAMPSANYAVAVCMQRTANQGTFGVFNGAGPTPTTTTCRVATTGTDGITSIDPVRVHLVFFG